MPSLTPPVERLRRLAAVLGTEDEPIVVLTHLLRLCRDDHTTLWEHHGEPGTRARVPALVDRLVRTLSEPGHEERLSARTRRELALAMDSPSDMPPVVVAHALAQLIDRHYGHTFGPWFRRRSPYQPAFGDPIPLDSPDLPAVTDLTPTSPPWRLANRLDETRRIRLAGAWSTQFRVVFDYSAFDALAGVMHRDTVIATGHPNHDLSELDLPVARDVPAFPIQPADLADQRARITHTVAEAAGAGASIVVLPELAVTEELAHDLETWVREPGPVRVLVAGSFHRIDSAGRATRVNRAMAWVRGHPSPLVHDKHSPADRPVMEDITPSGWPELRIHVSADGWHVVIAVCRDLLNPQAVHALTETGVNLVLAPAMSETLLPFGGPVAHLVGSAQAVVAIANNPAEWAEPATLPAGPDDHPRPARALFGHPGFGRQTRSVESPGPEVGVATLCIGDGRTRWRGAPSPPSAAAEDAAETLPVWLSNVLPVSSGHWQGARPVSLRPAAVLVLLSDGRAGPEVLLTTRAAALGHYAGQLVFPGGAADRADDGPVSTAVREAAEETGLDPGCVNVVGILPAFALAESAFVVTPVLGWTNDARFVHPMNPGEVTEVRWVPLTRDLDPGAAPGAPNGPEVGVMTQAILDILRARLVGVRTDEVPSSPTPRS